MSMTATTSSAPAVQPQGPTFAAELATKSKQFLAALPKQIPQERFMRVIMTAVQRNPDLLRADRQSLWNSAMQAASDGLLPDGREGALVIYNTKEKRDGKDLWIKKVQWLPMVGGIRKKVRNSKELSDWNAQVVHAKDEFEFELGDDPFIKHKPFSGAGDPGPVIAAYSVATFRGTGDKSREVMMRVDLDRVRAASKSPDTGPWKTWFEEMCRKTVAKRHAKVLPMVTDLDDLIRRDDALYDLESASDKVGTKRLALGGRLDALADMSDPGQDEPLLTKPGQAAPTEVQRSEATDAETGEVTQGGGEAQADATPAEDEVDATPTDPREATLVEARGRIMSGEKWWKVGNSLGERRQLLTDEDVKALKDAEKAVAANGKSAVEASS